MIGKRILFRFPDLSSEEAKKEGKMNEGNGVVVDKVKISDPYDAGIVLTNDIYVVEEQDGSILTIHPCNVVRIIK